MTKIAYRALGAALMILLVGCASSPSSHTSSESEAPPASAATSSSPEPLDLEGRMLLGSDTLYVGNANGTDLKPLFARGSYGGIFRISPDRTQILTVPGNDEIGTVTPPPVPPGIVVQGGILDIATGRFTILPQPDPKLTLVPQAWSPDGSRIAFEAWDESDPSRTGVYTMRTLDGGDMVRVTNSPGLPHDTPLDYSPDGTQIVLYRAIRAEPNFPIDLGGSLWVVNVDGSNLHQLDTGDASPWWQARWSPDGSVILFSTERLKPTGPLWTIKPDGTGLTKLYEDPAGGYATAPVWSPDGSQILFALNPYDVFQHPENAIYVINADGTNPRLVIDGPGFKGVQDWWQD